MNFEKLEIKNKNVVRISTHDMVVFAKKVLEPNQEWNWYCDKVDDIRPDSGGSCMTIEKDDYEDFFDEDACKVIEAIFKDNPNIEEFEVYQD